MIILKELNLRVNNLFFFNNINIIFNMSKENDQFLKYLYELKSLNKIKNQSMQNSEKINILSENIS
jgi:hypothetical protein